jgi:hypothetical protein
VEAELEKIKSVIDHSVSYCMLRVFIWGSKPVQYVGGLTNPTCLELYFCVRKILGETPLDVSVL